MMKSPCIGCEFELADKNNPTCRECDKRVEYVESIGDMTHSVPEKSITLKEVVKMTKIEVEETNGIEIESQKPVIKEQTPVIPAKAGIQETGKKECIVDGCDCEVVARDFCNTHYKAWQDGRIKHPMLGKYFKVRGVKKQKSEARDQKSVGAGLSRQKSKIKKTAPAVSAEQTEAENARERILTSIADTAAEKVMQGVKANVLDAGLTISLDNYPRIKNQIDFLADKYLVNSEHVIIGLLGEALAARRGRSDHE